MPEARVSLRIPTAPAKQDAGAIRAELREIAAEAARTRRELSAVSMGRGGAFGATTNGAGGPAALSNGHRQLAQSAREAETALIREERAAQRAHQQVLNLTAAVARAGAPASVIGGVTAAYQRLEDVLSRDTVSTLALHRAQASLAAALGESRRQLQAFNTEQNRTRMQEFKSVIDQVIAASGGMGAGLGVVSRAMAAMASPLGVLTAGFGAFAGAAFLGTQALIENAKGVRAFMAVSDLGAEEADNFADAIQLMGFDMDTVRTAMFRLAGEIDQGGVGLRRLGISARDQTTGAMKPLAQVFLEARDRISQFSSAQTRNALSLDIFSRSAKELAPLFAMSRDELKRYMDEASKLSPWSEEAQKKTMELVRSQNALGIAWAGLKEEIGLTVAGPMAAFLNMLKEALQTSRDMKALGISPLVNVGAGGMPKATAPGHVPTSERLRELGGPGAMRRDVSGVLTQAEQRGTVAQIEGERTRRLSELDVASSLIQLERTRSEITEDEALARQQKIVDLRLGAELKAIDTLLKRKDELGIKDEEIAKLTIERETKINAAMSKRFDIYGKQAEEAVKKAGGRVPGGYDVEDVESFAIGMRNVAEIQQDMRDLDRQYAETARIPGGYDPDDLAAFDVGMKTIIGDARDLQQADREYQEGARIPGGYDPDDLEAYSAGLVEVAAMQNQSRAAMRESTDDLVRHNQVLRLQIRGQEAEARVLEDVAALRERMGRDLLPKEIEQLRSLREEEDRLNRALELTKGVAGAFDKAFSDLGTALVTAFVMGEGAAISWGNVMKGVAAGVLTELIRVVIVKNLIDGVTAGIGGIANWMSTPAPVQLSGPGVTSARGNVFYGGELMGFDSGGVVYRPTVFPMARGYGLMGESGAEAVMPLRRTPSGDLGVIAAPGGGNVQVQVVIENHAPGVQVRQAPPSRGPDGRSVHRFFVEQMNSAIAGGEVNDSMARQFGASPVVGGR